MARLGSAWLGSARLGQARLGSGPNLLTHFRQAQVPALPGFFLTSPMYVYRITLLTSSMFCINPSRNKVNIVLATEENHVCIFFSSEILTMELSSDMCSVH